MTKAEKILNEFVKGDICRDYNDESKEFHSISLKIALKAIQKALNISDVSESSPSYTEKECRDLVFDYAQFVIKCMEGKEESQCVGVWFDKNKKGMVKTL